MEEYIDINAMEELELGQIPNTEECEVEENDYDNYGEISYMSVNLQHIEYIVENFKLAFNLKLSKKTDWSDYKVGFFLLNGNDAILIVENTLVKFNTFETIVKFPQTTLIFKKSPEAENYLFYEKVNYKKTDLVVSLVSNPMCAGKLHKPFCLDCILYGNIEAICEVMEKHKMQQG